MKIILTILLIAFLNGCYRDTLLGVKQVKDISIYSSAIDLGINGVSELESLASKIPNNRNFKKNKTIDYQDINVTYLERSFQVGNSIGTQGVITSYYLLCDKMSGKFHEIAAKYDKRSSSFICLDSLNKDLAYFYLIVQSKSLGTEQKINFEVYEDKDKKPSKNIVMVWKDKSDNAKIKYQETKKRLKIIQDLPKNTYQQVILIGSKVCKLNATLLDHGRSSGFTENFTNGRIKIVFSDGSITWDYPLNWYACK